MAREAGRRGLGVREGEVYELEGREKRFKQFEVSRRDVGQGGRDWLMARARGGGESGREVKWQGRGPRRGGLEGGPVH